MNNDKFTAAAREEARRYHWELREGGDLYYPPLDFGQHMAEWARTHLAAQETDGERAVRELHKQAWHGELDYCPRCVDYEGAIWPCPTIRALDSARAARRDEEKR